MKFIRIHLRLEELRIERVLLLILLCAALSAMIIPDGAMQYWAFAVNLVTAFAAISGLTVFWIYRKRIDRFDFFVIFGCLLSANALGSHEMILLHSPQPERSFHLFHFVPVCMSLVCLWVIVTQLVRSLRRYEVLTESLSDTIALKTHQLEKSFNRLAKVERREAVDRERNRIMLDLHDGIGGQLVSTLAYMDSTGNKDATLKEALEAALRDLALVLDSLDSHDSLTTLLGMLRTRLEPLLCAHGLQFNWQILDDPIVPQAGPSSNLHLARIVQEAITNVIKHAKASTITVYTDERTIMISDDGVGIETADLITDNSSGHGLAGMRQRAESMGAAFDVRRNKEGTSVCLTFAPPS
jgi:signal transduction histidine kinase